MEYVKAEDHLDGKYTLATSDDNLIPEDVALRYKQHMELEKTFWTIKPTLEPHLLYHCKDEWIKINVLLCHLAFGPDSEMPNPPDMGSSMGHHEADMSWKLCIDGRILKRTELTSDQAKPSILLNIFFPPKIR